MASLRAASGTASPGSTRPLGRPQCRSPPNVRRAVSTTRPSSSRITPPAETTVSVCIGAEYAAGRRDPAPTCREEPLQPIIYADPTSEAHDGGPDHPERPERLTACLDALARAGLTPVTDVPCATNEQLARVHAVAFLQRLEYFCSRGGGQIDPDTYARRES